MRLAISAVVALALVACSSLQPLPIKAGETCYGCRKIITDVRFAAEIVDVNGRAFKFRTVACLAKYLDQHPNERLDGVFVTNYSDGRLTRAANATFVRAVIDEASMERNYYAFRSAQDAAAFAQERDASAVDWPAVLGSVKGN